MGRWAWGTGLGALVLGLWSLDFPFELDDQTLVLTNYQNSKTKVLSPRTKDPGPKTYVQFK